MTTGKLCKYFGISRQAFYKATARRKHQVHHEAEVIEMIKRERQVHAKMGGKKLYHLLTRSIQARGTRMGRDKFFILMRANDLLVKRRRKYAVTTDSHHHFRKYKNLIHGWQPDKPNRLWVSDITYIRTRGRFAYLFLITDAYSRKVVGWHLSSSLAIEGALKALKMALKQCSDLSGLIHHSDRGIQYCCKEYVMLLKKHNISISMAATGNCYENALAERINGILKNEYSLDETFRNEQEALKATREAVMLYNEYRPHWSLDLRIPAHVHAA